MAQTYTSAATSTNAGRLPAVYGKIPYFTGKVVLDYGCGKYIDHIRSALPGIAYLPFDPFNQPEEVNRESMALVRIAARTRTPVTVVCSNVLNVIDDDKTIQSISAFIRRVVLQTGGTAYVTVYEGDRSGIGRKTGPDQYQRNAPLRDYLRFFPGATMQRGAIVFT